MIISASLKALAAVPGISSVSDVSETDGQPAMLVEFSTGVKSTISKSEGKGTFEMKLEYMEWSDAKHQGELDSEDYARSIDGTYRMIDREMFADVHQECRELGLTA
jgi:hypothetical protein